jgi:hypothetical protein
MEYCNKLAANQARHPPLQFQARTPEILVASPLPSCPSSYCHLIGPLNILTWFLEMEAVPAWSVCCREDLIGQREGQPG